MAELEVENKQLRKELAQIRMERDIEKKAAAYFARESLQVGAHEGMAKPIPPDGHGQGVRCLP